MSLSFDPWFEHTRSTTLCKFEQDLRTALDANFHTTSHGRQEEWDTALSALPDIKTSSIELNASPVAIGESRELDIKDHEFTQQLKAFNPWRKGPWCLFGVTIDTEWRSDLKWARIAPHLSPLSGRQVLDIGCGNGYYMMRMLGEGARFVLGVDPTLLFLYQFASITRFIAPPLMDKVPATILPLRSEHLPAFGCFDTVFSMGILYHRKSPMDHLRELAGFLRPGGELVLETLVIEDATHDLLVPEGRYAKMGNVFSIPSTGSVERWLKQADFTHIRTVDVTVTTKQEQRATEWMTFQSLPDFLDPDDANKTIEGLPAPTRAVVIANKN
ncbi:MAG: tRNA 5-methoxyuridine(34)/uridine 5-oxyacetic acid(34) synthase CmoB [Pseudomonadales bacterium]